MSSVSLVGRTSAVKVAGEAVRVNFLAPLDTVRSMIDFPVVDSVDTLRAAVFHPMSAFTASLKSFYALARDGSGPGKGWFTNSIAGMLRASVSDLPPWWNTQSPVPVLDTLLQ
ncbi:unnamed protein product [Mycena citricolor]|uniref:Uncharacterized protein n=1 Tax=Mycena citricolor TaxID=2018698 RepID=A0AAD2HAB2_9AGAR|nr:unnamed protein product [Mycena citricolor]